MNDKERQLMDIHRIQRKQSQSRIEYDSKERLKKIAMKKFKTCFIAALAEFEDIFGHIWGHNLSEDQLTTEQKTNHEKWQQVRTNILNKGNTQARALVAEMDLHKVQFEGYKFFLRGENL